MTTTTKKINKTTIGPVPRPLPKGWRQVVGMLKGRRKEMETHVKKMRNGWD